MIPTPSAAQWAVAFALTLAVEVPLVVGSLGNRRRALAAAFAANVVTHPALVLALPRLVGLDAPTLLLAEVAVVAVEGALYARLVPASAMRAFAVALLANAASFAAGALATWATGWP